MNKQVELLLKLEQIEKKRLRRDQKKIEVERLEKKIARIDPKDLWYYRMKVEKAGSALAAVEEGVCRGCGMHYPDTNHIMQKLGLTHRSELVRFALKVGLLKET